MLLSKKEFRDLCGIKNNEISNYYKRGKFVYVGEATGEDAFIDTDIEINATFIEHRKYAMAKKAKPEPVAKAKPAKKEKAIPPHSPAIPPPPKPNPLPVPSFIPFLPKARPRPETKQTQEQPKPQAPILPKVPAQEKNEASTELFAIKKATEVKKDRRAQLENEKLEIANMQRQGLLIPKYPVQQFLKEGFRMFFLNFRDLMEKHIKMGAAKYGWSNFEIAEKRERYIAELNETYNAAIEECRKSLDTIINQSLNL